MRVGVQRRKDRLLLTLWKTPSGWQHRNAGEEVAGHVAQSQGNPTRASAPSSTPKPHAYPSLSASVPNSQPLAGSLHTNVSMSPQAQFIISYLRLPQQSPNLSSRCEPICSNRWKARSGSSWEQRLTTTWAYESRQDGKRSTPMHSQNLGSIRLISQ